MNQNVFMNHFVKQTDRWHLDCLTIVFILLTLTISNSCIFAQERDSSEPQATGKAFPDGITPSHVFARLDLVDRCLDRLILEKKVAAPELPPKMESQLGPLHVYQMVLACSMRVQELDEKAGVLAVPTISPKPRYYAPRDVLLVADLMFDGVQRVALSLDIDDLPDEPNIVSDKIPTDVFNLAVSIFLKLNALCGYIDITPSEVYAEMVRAADDVRSILRQADPESRYRVDAPPCEPGQKPGDVFEKCLDIRRLMNQHRISLGEKAVPLPTAPGTYEIRPRDVMMQTQIIIAELNFLKLRTDTISSTPLAIPVKSTKTPTDVHQQASLVEYLLRQVESGAKKSPVNANE